MVTGSHPLLDPQLSRSEIGVESKPMGNSSRLTRLHEWLN
jgi:hypothetical protein